MQAEELAEVLLGRLLLREDPAGAFAEDLARRGRPDAARKTVDESGAEGSFELGELSRDSRLTDPQHRRGPGDRALVQNGPEDPKMVEIQSHEQPYHNLRTLPV
jgi:hypothetical protein